MLAIAPAPAATATSPRPLSLGELESPWLTYLRNGNLLILDKSTAWLFDGTRWYRHAEKAETAIDPAAFGGSFDTLTVGATGGYKTRYDHVRLLSTRDLRVLYEGPGRSVAGVLAIPTASAAAATATDPYQDTAIAFEHAGTFVTLQLPNDGGQKEVSNIDYDTSTGFAVVSWIEGDTKRAAAYQVSSTKLLGSAVPHDDVFPTVSTVGRVQYYIAKLPPRPRPAPRSSSFPSEMPMPVRPGSIHPEPLLEYVEGLQSRSLVARDMTTGQVLRQREIRCNQFLGNPTVSPNGSTVLVTCGGQAIVLDGQTLAERRRIKDVIPGCDNGFDLSGRIVSDSPATLLVEGCGGISKMSLATGNWLCGDSPGVMGGPYEAMSFGGDLPKPKRAPAPRCSKSSEDSSRELLDHEGRFEWLYEEHSVLADGHRIELEPNATTPLLSPARDRLVYLDGNKLVIRALPSGQILGP